MRITMFAVGSTGDVRPYLILGRELQARGHRISLCAFTDFEESVRAAGMDFYPINSSARDFIATLMNGSTGVQFLNQVRLALKDQVGPLMADLEAACEHADAVISTYFGHMCLSVAEVAGLPYIQTQYYPMDRSAQMPIASAPGQRAGKAWNLLSYQMGYFLIELLERTYLSDWRESRGLPKLKLDGKAPYQALGHTIPVIYALSPRILPRPEDWGENIFMTGYWLREEETPFTPDPALEAFLSAGEPPLYIGFGSMANRDMGATLDIVLESLERTGLRAVISRGWCNAILPDSDRIFAAEFVPHSWLFRRVGAVVHHGGAGTTAAGLLAGKPTLVIPFGGDQPFWGERVRALGVGPRPIPRERLTVRRLSKALLHLTQDHHYAENAAKLSEDLSREDGVVKAADIIEHELRAWLRQEGYAPNLFQDFSTREGKLHREAPVLPEQPGR